MRTYDLVLQKVLYYSYLISGVAGVILWCANALVDRPWVYVVATLCAGFTAGGAIKVYAVRRRFPKVEDRQAPAWYDAIFLEATMIKDADLEPPDTSRAPFEETLANASMFLRQLWTLCEHYEKRATMSAIECKYERDPENRHRVHEIHSEVAAKHRFLREMFWQTAKETYGLWTVDGLGLRSNWDIVRTAPRPDVRQIMHDMMGEN